LPTSRRSWTLCSARLPRNRRRDDVLMLLIINNEKYRLWLTTHSYLILSHDAVSFSSFQLHSFLLLAYHSSIRDDCQEALEEQPRCRPTGVLGEGLQVCEGHSAELRHAVAHSLAHKQP
jgi:hypothetical protein